MVQIAAENQIQFVALLPEEQRRLVRLCAYLTGDSHAAEDLAQETLLIAWRQQERITDASGLTHWLTAIARNVCRHWVRDRGREQAHLVLPKPGEALHLSAADELEDDFDVELELERDELATLLDRALALIPPENRAMLVQHYIEGLPQAELAARLGISEGALAVRLHRGKLALRRTLTTNFRDEAATYGLVTPETGGWQATQIWCFSCGQRRLLGQRDPSNGALHLRCEACCDDGSHLVDSDLPELHQVKAYKPAYSRVLAWLDEYYHQGAVAGVVPCLRCQRPLRMRWGIPPRWPDPYPAIYAWCDVCGAGPGLETWGSLTQSLPAVRQFWRKYPHMRQLPLREIEAEGSAAVVTGFESLTHNARIEAIFLKDTFEVIPIYQDPAT